MRFEWPYFKKCCYCLPLRRGLLTFVYLNLIFNTVKIVSLCYVNSLETPNSHQTNTLEIIGIVYSVVEIICNILLLYGTHKGNKIYVRICYYSLVVSILATFLFALTAKIYLLQESVTITIWNNGKFYMIVDICLFLALINVGLQIYLVTLVRSYLFVLRNSDNSTRNSCQDKIGEIKDDGSVIEHNGTVEFMLEDSDV